MAFHRLIDRLDTISAEIRKAEREIVEWCRNDDASRRLMTVPGIGPITASAIAAAVPDASLFRSGRRDCQKFRVRGRVDHHAVTNLPSNIMAN
jgi:transposase